MFIYKIRFKSKAILFILFVFLLPAVFVPAQENISEGSKNFLALRGHYQQWCDGLFGSQNSYRRDLYMFCLDLIDKEIETDPEFILLSPIKYGQQSVECVLRTPNSGWLYIHGPVTASDALLKERPLPGSWRQSLSFLRIRGTVRKFRLGRDRMGNTVDIWLNKVELY